MTQEQQDDAVQSMRDQGIRDACEGRSPKFWLSGGALLGTLKSGNGASYEITREWDGEQEYRAAFAYARAYAANCVPDPDPFNDAGDELNDMGGGDRG